jgi:cytochrome c1
MIMLRGARRGAAAVLVSAALSFAAGAALAAGGEEVQIERQKWTFGGFFGKFDDGQLQRGFKVYVEACARCHSVKRLHFRNLVEPGGPQFPEGGVKTLADGYQVDDGVDDQGKPRKRPGILADAIPGPYKTEQEARAGQNGALPPDLSLIVRARAVETHAPFYMVPFNMVSDVLRGYQESGADYLYAYLRGFMETPPPAVKMAELMNYNKVFPGHQTAMADPFRAGDGLIKYDDDTPGTVENYSRDVVAFLAWASDPKLEERKRIGLLAMIYLAITAFLLFLAKRRVWSKMH